MLNVFQINISQKCMNRRTVSVDRFRLLETPELETLLHSLSLLKADELDFVTFSPHSIHWTSADRVEPDNSDFIVSVQ